jgi:ubiquinone/menaquinone biosynthesis C-methylase UbiE
MYIKSAIRRFFLKGKTQQASDAYWARQEAYNYEQIFPERHRRQIAFTAEHLFSRMKQTDVVVDLGCADGWHSLVVAQHCTSLHGYDYNPKFIALAAQAAMEQNAAHCRFTTANILELELPPKSADVVLLSGLTTCMVGDRDASHALSVAANTLKRGGFVLFKDTLHRGEGNRFNLQEGYGAVYRDLENYRKLIAAAGVKLLTEAWIDETGEYGSLMALGAAREH